MPTLGLSLVGFMDQQPAVNHLSVNCVPKANATPVTLIAEWQKARGRLGKAARNPGLVQPRPLNATQAAYVSNLMTLPWVNASLADTQAAQANNGLAPASFAVVDIKPLLAYQFVVDRARSLHHCATLSKPPTEAELLSLCLPATQPTENFTHSIVDPASKSIIIKSRSHNLRGLRHGLFDVNLQGVTAKVAGLALLVTLPFVHVVRFNGKCYLHNGYHRAYGAVLAGATEMPCLFRDAASAGDAGIMGGAATFDLRLLGSANPPTIAHFSVRRAYPVKLRVWSRILHVSWAEHSMPDE